jgi:hypothetical protein
MSLPLICSLRKELTMTTLVSLERQGRPPIRIFRGAAQGRRAAAFQPEWQPLDYPDLPADAPGCDERNARRRVPQRWFDRARSVALSVSVSAFVTLVLTIREIGLAQGWTQAWLTTLKLSLLIGLPARFLIEPYVARLVALFVQPPAPGA